MSTSPAPIVGTRLVDVDVTVRVIDSEVSIPADLDVEEQRAQLRDYLARRVAREFSDTATVAVAVTVREV